MNQARAQQNIQDIEICHYMLNRNLAVLTDSLVSGSDAHVYGCGDVGTERLRTAFLFSRVLECWVTDADVYLELSPLFTQVSALLGDKTEKKTSLVKHLVNRLRDNGYKAYPDEEEDFATLESRIQHLEICHPDWDDNLFKVLHEIGQQRMIYEWNKSGGFFACGSVCKPNAFPAAFLASVAAASAVSPPEEITQESVQKMLEELMDKNV